MKNTTIPTTDDKILLGRDESPLVQLMKMLLIEGVVFGSRDELKQLK